MTYQLILNAPISYFLQFFKCFLLVITLLAYNGQGSADEVKHKAMTNRLSVDPTGTCLGIEDLDYPALRAPDVDRPPG